MIGLVPPTPTGNDGEAIWFRWATDALKSITRVGDVAGQRTNRTTQGTFTVPEKQSSKEDADIGKRLFNLSNYTIYGSPVWSLGSFDGLNLGATITGFPAVQDKIKKALNDGRRIRTTMSVWLALQQLTVDVESECTFEVRLYAGGAIYAFVATGKLHSTATNGEFIFTHSAEISQKKSGSNVIVTEANAVNVPQMTGAQAGLHVPWKYSLVSAAYGAPAPNTTDGRIIGGSVDLVNASGSVGFRSLTIDSLPPIG